MDRPAALYRYFDADDRLLYVGASANPFRRASAHHSQRPWFSEVVRITVDWHPSPDEAMAAEGIAIKAECPRHNLRKGSPGRPVGSGGGSNDLPCGPLGSWMVQHDVRQRDLARSLGLSEGYLSRLVHDLAAPSKRLALRIEAETKGAVPASVWDQQPAMAAE